MVHSQATNFRSLAARLVFGSIAPALAILAFFGLQLASTAFAYVIAIVPVPLMGSCSAARYLPSCRWRASIGFGSADLNSGLQFAVMVAGCLADLVDAGAEQPGGRRRSHHPKRGEQGE
jgi:hypothetical protein